MTDVQAQGARRAVPLVIALGLLTTLAPLSIDLYLAAFPRIGDDLGASEGAVQFTLGGMTLGLALGHLLTGTWSDRVGRRRPLVLATALHVLVTFGCAAAPTIEVLVVLRFVQGVAAAGGAVLVLAIARDLSEGRELLRLLSRITLVTTTVPLLAPVAGAFLLPVVGWRGIFVVLGVFSLAVLVVTAVMVPETRPGGGAATVSRARLSAVVGDSGFRVATFLGAMTYAGVYAYVAASPLVLQDLYGLAPALFASVFLANSLGLVVGVQVSAALQRRIPGAPVIAGSAALSALAAVAIVPLQHLGAGLAGLLPCLWLFVTGCGGCFAGAVALALRDQSGRSGTATSVYGFTTFLAAGLIAPVTGLLGLRDLLPVAVLLTATSVAGTAAAVTLVLRDRRVRTRR